MMDNDIRNYALTPSEVATARAALLLVENNLKGVKLRADGPRQDVDRTLEHVKAALDALR
jgi:hypothetical protein